MFEEVMQCLLTANRACRSEARGVGFDVNGTNISGETPLATAIKEHGKEDKNIEDKRGDQSHIDKIDSCNMASLLVRNGADPKRYVFLVARTRLFMGHGEDPGR